MKRSRLLAVLFCGMCFVGCDKVAERTVEVSAASNDLNKVVFAVVDGRPLTAAQVKDAVLITAQIRKMKKQPVRSARFARWANNAAMIIMGGMVSNMLVEDEAKRRGVKATPESDARVLSRYDGITRRKVEDPKELAKLFGKLRKPFRELFARESLREAFFATLDVPVTADEVDKFMQTASNRVKRITRANEAARTKGRKAWEALQRGETWEAVAAKFHEKDLAEDDETDSTREWYTFRLKDCVFEQVGKAIVGKKEGEYTEPLETEGGLMIVKVAKIEGDVYTCVRIFFRMMKDLPLPDRKIAEKMVARRNADRRQYELLKALREKHPVDYPLGTNFVYKIWDEPKPASPRPKSRPKEVGK